MSISSYELFKQFEEHSVAEFFRRNRQMLGFVGKVRSLTMIVHELVTNGLDAAEAAGVLPEIKVKVEKVKEEVYTVEVSDNGSGIPLEYIPEVFGKMLKSTKFRRYMQTRGKQGIGASAVTLYAQMTTGEPVYVISRYRDKNMQLWEAKVKVKIDVAKNEPDIVMKRKELIDNEKAKTGLTVRVKVGEVLYRNDEQGVLEYLKRTALVNPHARIVLKDPDGNTHIFGRAITTVIKPPKETKPHPYGLSPDDLLFICKLSSRKTVRLVLLNDLIRVTNKKIEELKSELKRLGKNPDEILEKEPSKLTFQEAELIVKIFKKMKFISPPLDVLRPLGAEYIKASMKKIYNPEFVYAEQRKPSVYWGGVPFLVEGGIAYGGNAGRDKKLEIVRVANNVPLLFDNSACVIFKEIKEFNWKSYGLSGIDEMPVSIMIHVVSTHIPYTTAGKQAISDIPEIRKEIHLLLTRLASKLSNYIKIKKKLEKLKEHKKLLKAMIPLISEALANTTSYSANEIEAGLEELVAMKFKELDNIKKRLGVEL